MERSFRQKLNRNREIMELTDIMHQMDLTQTQNKYTFFLAPQRTLAKIDHTFDHKPSLYRSKKIRIAPCILSVHDGILLDLNNRNNRKPTNLWKLNNSILNDHLVKEEIRKEIEDLLQFNKNECTTYPNLWATD